MVCLSPPLTVVVVVVVALVARTNQASGCATGATATAFNAAPSGGHREPTAAASTLIASLDALVPPRALRRRRRPLLSEGLGPGGDSFQALGVFEGAVEAEQRHVGEEPLDVLKIADAFSCPN